MTDANAERVAALVRERLDAPERLRVRKAAEEWLTEWGFNGKLPSGEQGESTECVLAHALGGSFGGSDWVLPEDRLAAKLGFHDVAIPDDVCEFIRRFDGGEYPDLIEERQE
jgi:hypothetical protein